jgi:hypothetical protein
MTAGWEAQKRLWLPRPRFGHYVSATGVRSYEEESAIWEGLCTRLGSPPSGSYAVVLAVAVWIGFVDQRWSLGATSPPDGSPRNERFPGPEELKALFSQPAEGWYRVAHVRTNAPGLYEQLKTCMKKFKFPPEGIQINSDHDPDPSAMARVLEENPGMAMILSVRERVIEDAIAWSKGGSALDPRRAVQAVAQWVYSYSSMRAITHALIDKSGGLGRALDPDQILELLETLSSWFPHIYFGAAGGLDPYLIPQQMGRIWERQPASSDSESRLMGHDNRLALGLTVKYLESCLSMTASAGARSIGGIGL